jgi:hypothetical protein
MLAVEQAPLPRDHSATLHDDNNWTLQRALRYRALLCRQRT